MIAIFPGQGSQFVGMSKDLFQEFPVVKRTFEEASDSIHIAIDKLCFDGPEDKLNLTENTQPCLLTASIASFRLAQTEFDFHPKLTAGHSLGEYSALVAAGAISFTDAVNWVKKRGQAMQVAVPVGQGAMAAILNVDETQMKMLCSQAIKNALEKRAQLNPKDFLVDAWVQPANFNAPGQIVIAGSKDAVTEAIELCKQDVFSKAKAILLPVSAPFHSKLMKPAREQMQLLFDNLTPEQKPKALQCSYLPNFTAKITSETETIIPHLIEQIDHPVLWQQTMTEVLNQGYTSAIEFGPGKVLQGLNKRIAKNEKKSFDTHLLNNLDSLTKLETILKGTLS